MAIQKANIIPGTFLTTSLSTLYTAPTNVRADVTKFTLFNSSAGAVLVNIYIVRSGGTASGVNQKAMNLNISSGQSIELGAARGFMEPGDFIQGNDDTGGAVAVTADANLITR